MPAPRVVLGRRPPEGYDCRIGTGANVSCGYRDLTPSGGSWPSQRTTWLWFYFPEHLVGCPAARGRPFGGGVLVDYREARKERLRGTRPTVNSSTR
jgi:hypothetical protein